MTNVDQAPEKAKRPRVATHDWIDANGDVVDDMEGAVGTRYLLAKVDEPFTWSWNEANDAERMMLAIFGARTLATNESSAVRNSEKGAGSPTEQMQAVIERFANLRNGLWSAPSGEPGAPRVDKEKLASAIVDEKIELGKITEAQRDDHWEEIRAKLDADGKYLRNVKNYPPVAARYAKLMGRSTITADDL